MIGLFSIKMYGFLALYFKQNLRKENQFYFYYRLKFKSVDIYLMHSFSRKINYFANFSIDLIETLISH